METKKKLSILMCCALIASVCTNAIAADEDGWTQADRTDAAADGAWDAWKTAWETEKTNFEHISLTPGKDETELNFAWYSKAESGTPEFKFYEKDGGEETAETVQVVQSDAIPGYYSNKVTVTGLEAGKIYCYSYTKDDGEWTDTEEYTAKDTTNGFSFVFMGDPQIGSSYANTRDDADDAQGQDLAVCNDSFNWNNTINKALGMNPDVNFIVSAGDQIQSRDKKTPEVTHESYTENEIEYAGYLLPEALKTLPVATTIGNHDSPSSNYTYHFNNPNVDETLGYTYAGTDYYFSYGNALFVMLNTNNTNAAEHKQLIEKAVEENGDKEWRIIMLHQDIYGPGEHSNEPEIVELRYSLMPIFEEYDIDVVLTGHDHAYSRSQIMKNAEISKYDWDTTAISTEDFEAVFGVDDPDEEQKARYDDYLAMIEDKDYVMSSDSERVVNPDGVLYITANSASGSKFYDLVEHQQAYIAARWQEDVPTFSMIDVTENEFTINTYRTDTLEKIDTEFTIVKNDDAQVPYTINSSAIKGTDGAELDEIPADRDFIAEVSLTKNKATDGKDYLIIAAYDENGTLTGMNYSYADVPEGSSYTFGVHITQPESGSIAEIKAYVWDGFSGMEPLAFNGRIK